MHKVCAKIDSISWRTNPNALAGARIALFRKGPTPTPTMIVATAIEATGLAYSKLRVSFSPSVGDVGPDISHAFGSIKYKDKGEGSGANIGEISEPFWVQRDGNSSWMEPDELYQLEIKDKLSITDKRMFWEMSRSIIDLHQLASKLTDTFKTSKEIATFLSRPENLVLWTADAPQFLPKDASIVLIQNAYCLTLEEEKGTW